MSILGEYLQRVKAERDEAVKLLREAQAVMDDDAGAVGMVIRIEAFLSRYDLPDDYDEG